MMNLVFIVLVKVHLYDKETIRNIKGSNIIHKHIALFALTTALLSATTIQGIGYASIPSEAKKEALGDLSSKISVDVKSDFTTITKTLGDEYSKSREKLVSLSSNLPILGVSFDELVGDTLVKSTATINSTTAIELYKMELKRLNKNISYALLELETIKNDDGKYTLLTQLLHDIESFNKHKIVATLLDAKHLPILATTKSEITSKLQSYIQKAPSLKIASDILTQNIKEKSIYISTIKENGSDEVTQLAKLLKSEMMSKLDSVKQPSKAKYFLRGEYEILKNSIFITTTLSDSYNNLLKTNTISLNPSAYKNTTYKPSTKTFDKALQSEFVKSGKLNVSIGFKGYSRTDGIDLYKGDSVDIVVKSNKAMCYFLLGHTLKDDDKFSYLLPIGSDNTPYINSITGEDVNRYITIADDVPIEEPFGRENLQIYASTFSKDGICPLVVPNTVQNEDGYDVVSATPSKAITQTRALNLRKKKFTIEQSEASIDFTSFIQ